MGFDEVRRCPTRFDDRDIIFIELGNGVWMGVVSKTGKKDDRCESRKRADQNRRSGFDERDLIFIKGSNRGDAGAFNDRK